MPLLGNPQRGWGNSSRIFSAVTSRCWFLPSARICEEISRHGRAVNHGYREPAHGGEADAN